VSFSRVCGQPRAVERLQSAIRSGRLAHAYLFTGAAGVGKRTLARELAKAVLCEQGKGDSCDRCRECRAVEEGGHADFGVLLVEEGGGGGGGGGSSAAGGSRFRPIEDSDREIKIASIRELTRALSLRSASGRTRAYLIPGAERMNEEAANALLKTLEEPVGSRLLILTTTRPEALLPTVLSRVARLRLRSLSTEEVADYLTSERKLPRDAARELAAASGGSIGAALAASLDAVRAARRFVAERLTGAPGRPLELSEAMMDYARAAAEAADGRNKTLEPVRRELLSLWRQALLAHRSALAAALGAGSPDPAEDRLAALGAERLEHALGALLRADRAVRDYASPELVCRVLAGELAAIARG
jgi:DNA polymerase-3 subunit delta'